MRPDSDDKVSADKQLAELGVFVHGALAALHALGLVYNLRRRNWAQSAIHAGALAFDVHSVAVHLADVRDSGLDGPA